MSPFIGDFDDEVDSSTSFQEGEDDAIGTSVNEWLYNGCTTKNGCVITSATNLSKWFGISEYNEIRTQHVKWVD